MSSIVISKLILKSVFLF